LRKNFELYIDQTESDSRPGAQALQSMRRRTNEMTLKANKTAKNSSFGTGK